MSRRLSILATLLMTALMIVLISACAAQPVAPAAAPAEETAVQDGDEELSGELIVFAAASLADAFGEIATNFQAEHPKTTIVYNFAGSQQLAQQLGQAAPADVFAPANGSQMKVAIEAGRVVSGTQRTFARNRLVVIYPVDNPAGITTLQDLAKPGIKLVLAAPEVPVGGYSLAFLDKASTTVEFGSTYSETVISNVVSYEENVRSVLSKIVLGEADAGIVYSSDVSGDTAAQVSLLAIPDELNTLASYPIAAVADSTNPALAAAFVAYVLDAPGQTVLADYGFIPIIGTDTGEAPAAAPVEVAGKVVK